MKQVLNWWKTRNTNLNIYSKWTSENLNVLLVHDTYNYNETWISYIQSCLVLILYNHWLNTLKTMNQWDEIKIKMVARTCSLMLHVTSGSGSPMNFTLSLKAWPALNLLLGLKLLRSMRGATAKNNLVIHTYSRTKILHIFYLHMALQNCMIYNMSYSIIDPFTRNTCVPRLAFVLTMCDGIDSSPAPASSTGTTRNS